MWVQAVIGQEYGGLQSCCSQSCYCHGFTHMPVPTKILRKLASVCSRVARDAAPPGLGVGSPPLPPSLLPLRRSRACGGGGVSATRSGGTQAQGGCRAGTGLTLLLPQAEGPAAAGTPPPHRPAAPLWLEHGEGVARTLGAGFEGSPSRRSGRRHSTRSAATKTVLLHPGCWLQDHNFCTTRVKWQLRCPKKLLQLHHSHW